MTPTQFPEFTVRTFLKQVVMVRLVKNDSVQDEEFKQSWDREEFLYNK